MQKKKEIMKGRELCRFFGGNCAGEDCPAFQTFTDSKNGLCSFDIGGAVVKVIPGIVHNIANGLAKFLLLVLLVFAFAGFCFSDESWEENRKYMEEKFSNLQATCVGIKTEMSGLTTKLDTFITKQNDQELKIAKLETNVCLIEERLKDTKELLYGLIGAAGITGLWGGSDYLRKRQRKRAAQAAGK